MSIQDVAKKIKELNNERRQLLDQNFQLNTKRLKATDKEDIALMQQQLTIVAKIEQIDASLAVLQS